MGPQSHTLRRRSHQRRRHGVDSVAQAIRAGTFVVPISQ